MLRSLAISRIQRGLGFRSDLTDEIIDALKEAQRFLEGARTLPHFLIEQDASLSVVAATQAIDLPAMFLRTVEDEGLRYTNADGELYWLTKKPFDEASTYYSEYDAGEPLAYSLRKETIYVFPEPDTNYTLTWSYYKKADVLDSDIENAWLEFEPDMLIGKAGMIIALDLEHEIAYQKFEKMYNDRVEWRTREMAAREDQNMPRAMGRNQ